MVRSGARAPAKRRTEAVKILNARLAALGHGETILKANRIATVGDLREILLAHYAANKRKSANRTALSFAHVIAYFGANRKASTIKPADVTGYAAARAAEPHRQGSDASNASINREITALAFAMKLAQKSGRLAAVLKFDTLNERDNVREGFFERPELDAVLAELPAYMIPFVKAAYFTGWRTGELLSRTWEHVDFKQGVIRLEPGQTKNSKAREFPFASLPELRELLESQRERAAALECPLVFFHYETGASIKKYGGTFARACKRAGISKLMHDFRRTAVRNLERAGVPRSASMKLTGHKTESVFTRYAITDSAMLAEGVEKLTKFHDRQSNPTDNVIDFPVRRSA
jgi:integrase